MKKKAQVHLLSTNGVSKGKNIFIIWADKLRHQEITGDATIAEFSTSFKNWVPQHLYFTTDEKIRIGDWFMYTDGGSKDIKQCIRTDDKDNIYSDTGYAKRYVVNKIVATTNPKLWYKDDSSLQKIAKISDGFTQHYIKSHNEDDIIGEVMIDYDLHSTDKPNSTELSSTVRLTTEGACITWPVEDRVYTIKQIKRAIKEAISHPEKFVIGICFDNTLFHKWIEENT